MSIAKAGKLVLLSEGVYDSYGVIGAVKVLEDFIPAQALDTYLKLNPRQKKKGYFDYPKYVDFLLDQGLIEEMPYDTLYLGNHDCADSVGYTVG